MLNRWVDIVVPWIRSRALNVNQQLHVLFTTICEQQLAAGVKVAPINRQIGSSRGSDK
jgi:hypothetical protein